MQAAIILGIILLILIIGWGISISTRECQSNDNCEEKSYCGSDFKCHEYPVIIKEIEKNKLLWPSFFIAAAIVIASIILKYKKT